MEDQNQTQIKPPDSGPHAYAQAQPMGGFQWGWPDTAALIALAFALIAAYYPMALMGRIPDDYRTVTYYFPLLSIFQDTQIMGWNPYQLAGCSSIANPAAALFYPLNWLFFFLPLPSAFILTTLGHYYLAAAGMYLLARFSRLSVGAGIVSALVYSLGGYMASHLFMRPVLMSSAWLPWIFLCYLYGHYRNVLLGYLIAAVFLGFQILTGQPHSAVTAVFALGLFALYKAIADILWSGQWRVGISHLLRFALFLLIGIMLSAVSILPALELLPHTISGQTAFQASTTSGALPLSWIPDIFFGASYHQAFNQRLFLESNCYLGVVAVWLILFGLVGHWHKGIFWFYLALAILSVLLALGPATVFFNLFHRFPFLQWLGLPGIGALLDFPLRFLGLTAFALAMLAGYGMDVLAGAHLRSGSERLNRQGKFILAFLILGCVVWAIMLTELIFKLGADVVQLAMNPSLISSQSVFFSQVTFSFFTLVFGSFTIAYLLGYLRPRLFKALLAVVLLTDLLHTGSQIDVEYKHPRGIFMPPIAVRYLKDRAPDIDPNARVVGFDALKGPGPDSRYRDLKSILMPKLGLYYRLRDVAGYDKLLLKRYSRLLQQTVSPPAPSSPPWIADWNQPVHPLLNLLRVGFISGEVNEKVVFRQVMEIRSGERRNLMLDFEKPCHEIRIRSFLRDGIRIKENQLAGEVRLVSATGEKMVLPLRAGRETADQYAEAAHYHHPARRYRSWSTVLGKRKVRVHNYVCRIELPKPFKPASIEIHNQSEARLFILGIAMTERGDNRFELVYGSQYERVYRNPDALPVAWWVYDAHVEPSEARTLRIMEENQLPDGTPLDYRRTALLERQPVYPLKPPVEETPGTVNILEYQPGRITLEAKSETPGMLVFSEMHYPGWMVRVNDRPGRIHRANYILRGLSLPAGTHYIEMEYQPRSFYFGLLASILTVALIILLFLRFRRQFPVKGY